MRSIPMPNAKPEYVSGSIPPIQPEPEQGRQVAPPALPVPEQKTHETATSTPGSTNGKNVGPNRIFVSGVKSRRENAASVPFRSANVTPSSTCLLYTSDAADDLLC